MSRAVRHNSPSSPGSERIWKPTGRSTFWTPAEPIDKLNSLLWKTFVELYKRSSFRKFSPFRHRHEVIWTFKGDEGSLLFQLMGLALKKQSLVSNSYRIKLILVTAETIHGVFVNATLLGP
ncbi:unnamed protein product [Calypogeia fissa]